MQEDKNTNSAWACAAAAVAGCLAEFENSDAPEILWLPEVLSILDDLALAAKELIVPQQKLLGVVDLNEYTLRRIEDAVSRAQRKAYETGRKLNLLIDSDKDLVLDEIKEVIIKSSRAK